ncbi:MAG: copper chaperone PCu(A)C [Aquabacterium sp.]|uniref:copper chaperone PCu(A)C n=1 Tax=Aquabacterium sp. TaxID=1872578 RepID=UPI0025B9C4AD|nr:copper chaperone PCu(A)C [Aquabacterium sp.]MBI5924967.1 copper chaperone PCu(A)C [Aquabacterium sp.]
MFFTSVRFVCVASLLCGLTGVDLSAHAADQRPVKGAASTVSGVIKVDNAWIRATVKGQSGTGGFMNLTASQPLTLVGFSTTVAADSELHEMAMDGNVMRMQAVASLPLPAGQTVELRPGMGGHHLMLMGLKQQLKDGDEVALTLKLRTADGKSLTQDVKVPVRSGSMTMTPAAGATSGAQPAMKHNHMHQGPMHEAH